MANFYNPYNSFNIDRIDKQIQDLQNMKANAQMSMQQIPSSGIQNIINTNSPKIVDVEARFLKNNESVNDIIVETKTLFVDENNKQIYLKELDGSISKTYDIVIPLTEEQLKIKELEESNLILNDKLKEMEGILNGFKQHNKPSDEVIKSDEFDNGDVKPTTKKSSK